jgi:CDGSH-type Zn-finger protein/uncharacterized Fe-S cluster protein YjdI
MSVREYPGEQVTVTYDRRRCIHFEECIHGDPAVFQKDARPWIDSAHADPVRTTAVIERCPTGALHYRRADGVAELPPASNTVVIDANGPLLVHANMLIENVSPDTSPDGSLRETRAAFCRCGASSNKPLCDGTHSHIGFQDPGMPVSQGAGATIETSATGLVTFTPLPDGPLCAMGALLIENTEKQPVAGSQETCFCRCGASNNKPYCDGSHARIGFKG